MIFKKCRHAKHTGTGLKQLAHPTEVFSHNIAYVPHSTHSHTYGDDALFREVGPRARDSEAFLRGRGGRHGR